MTTFAHKNRCLCAFDLNDCCEGVENGLDGSFINLEGTFLPDFDPANAKVAAPK